MDNQQCKERRSGNAERYKVDQLLRNSEPLDEQEQQEVIMALESQQLQQARTFRRLYAGLALALAAFFGYAAMQQHYHPWEAKYTGELRPVSSAEAVTSILLLQATALLAAGLGLLVELPKHADHSRACMPPAQRSQLLVGAALFAAGVGCLYWLSALYHSIAKYGYAVGGKLELLWLPLGPLGYCVLCWHLLASLANTSQELKQLRKLAYDYKKV